MDQKLGKIRGRKAVIENGVANLRTPTQGLNGKTPGMSINMSYDSEAFVSQINNSLIRNGYVTSLSFLCSFAFPFKGYPLRSPTYYSGAQSVE